jgi:hypothetical protein
LHVRRACLRRSAFEIVERLKSMVKDLDEFEWPRPTMLDVRKT